METNTIPAALPESINTTAGFDAVERAFPEIEDWDFLRSSAPSPMIGTAASLFLHVWTSWWQNRVDDTASKVLAIRIPPEVEAAIKEVRDYYELGSKREAVMLSVLVGARALIYSARRNKQALKAETSK